MKAVVLGAAGLLGRALVGSPPPGVTIAGFTRESVDITDAGPVRDILRREQPDWVLNATAYTDVDGAEGEQDRAFSVNGTAVGALASLCAELRCGLAHFSTDYVFAGDRDACYREDDPVAPVNAYGASKEAGERAVREIGGKHLIIRTQWLFGPGGRAFLSSLAQRARGRQPIRVVSDEFGHCTFVEDLTDASWALLGRAEGTFHVANRGRVSRFDVARRVYEAAGAGDLVTPVSTRDVPMTARRPTSSVLCLEKVEGTLGRPMPDWTDAVDRYLTAVA